VKSKIIIFISTNKSWGGSEELWAQTAVALAMQGLHIVAFIYESMRSHPKIKTLEDAGVTIHTFPLPFTRLRRMRRKFYKAKAQLLFDFEEQLPNQPPALVVISDGAALPPIDFIEMCIIKRWSFVTIGQCIDARWWPEDQLAERYRFGCQAALRCYFVAAAILRDVEIWLGCKIKNAEIVWNPFNVNFDAESPWLPLDVDSCLRLASVGRLHPPSKGQDMLFEALAHPEWAQRSWHLTLYGDGPNRRGLEQLCDQLGLSKNISFAGYLADIQKIWEMNHVLVMPSRYEGLPLAIVEAMLCGRAVLATDVGGNGEMVENGVTGILIDAPTVRSIESALESLWSRRLQLEEMGRAGAKSVRRKIVRNPIETFAKKILDLAMSN
jgi:glycosyltransferase involved in cell wall biosynthesis